MDVKENLCGGRPFMNNPVKIIALVGTYRKGGIIDTAIDEILASAREAGAETTKVSLLDKHIAFCTNCRACTQQPGETRGPCPLKDEMSGLLDAIERSDALVLGSPMNFWTVSAVMKRFMERLVCYAYWPWGANAPKIRTIQKRTQKRAVVVASSAAPAIMARLSTQIISHLKKTAALLGARKIDVLFIGLAAQEQHQALSERVKTKARALGKKLVQADQ
jgi:FMN-dependent NADH-azoreductase